MQRTVSRSQGSKISKHVAGVGGIAGKQYSAISEEPRYVHLAIKAIPERSGSPLLKLAEQKVVRKVRFCCKATKYVPKVSYFALKSSKIVSFFRPRASGGRWLRPRTPLQKFLDPLLNT